MIIDTILQTKGRDVVTIGEMATLEEAARLLDAHGIGALVVTDDHARPVAVLSERDIVREMALNGGAGLYRPVAHAMTQAFVTTDPHAGLDALMRLMTERRVRHLPVLEAGRLVGIISIGDVVKARIADMEAEHAALQDYIRS